MEYWQAVECDDISRGEALRELARHGCTSPQDIAEFDRDVKPDARGCYSGGDVLGWLGY